MAIGSQSYDLIWLQSESKFAQQAELHDHSGCRM
jgi:hypothetical protein